MRRMRYVLSGTVAVLAGAAIAAAATAGGGEPGFKTAQHSMLTPLAPGSSVTPILTVGDALPSGYRYEAIPDGIALKTRGHGRVDLYVNHETSRVPFPYTPAAPTEANSQNDYDNAQLSLLSLSQHGAGVLQGSIAIGSQSNYQRFCSNYLGTAKEGFDRPIVLTNEEAVEWVNRTGAAWPATVGSPAARQSGVVVAYDVRSGKHQPIWGMGRFNHENSVPLPGFHQVVTLSSDDTFASNPAQSQVYSYIARDAGALLHDRGDLWAFVSDTPGYDDYYDFAPGDTTSIQGHFVKVPKDIATGRNPDGTDMVAADKGYPAPPGGGAWATSADGTPVDGPQWVLEHWGDLNHVFQFVRVEDIAYDKRPGAGNVVYLADSGRGSSGAPGAGTSTNGRIWKMVLDPADPTHVTSLSILIEGDDQAVKTPGEIHQPDNLETTQHSLLIQEDPGSSQHFNPGEPNATEARIWRYDLAGGGPAAVVAKVDQSADGGPTDVDGLPNGKLGAWESTGIVDASSAFGPGAFLVNIQAHTLWVQKSPGADNVAPPGPDFTDKREGGQLVLLRIPGA